MNVTVHKYKYLQLSVYAGVLLASLMTLWSCVEEYAPDGRNKSEMIDISIALDIPDHKPSRSVSKENENQIERIVALVFNDQNKFAYKAESTIKPDNTILIRMIRSVEGGDKYKIILISNVTVPQFATGEGMANIQKQLTFNSAGKIANPFPMWGETPSAVIDNNTSFAKIKMVRAIARIDVGLKFVSTVNGSEEALGLEDNGYPYKLTKLYLVNSLAAGYVVPESTAFDINGAIVSPSIDTLFTRNSTLNFTSDIDSEGNMCVRSIYTSENTASGEGDSYPISIIAGITRSGSESFYRIDITQNNSSERLPILRNRRYILNILNITGKGWSTLEDAISSKPKDIKWELRLDDKEYKAVYVSGANYIAISDYKISLPGRPGNTDIIYYETNLPKESLNFAWARSQSIFKQISASDTTYTYSNVAGYATGTVTITTLSVNGGLTPTPKTEQLKITASPITPFNIGVTQEIVKPEYTIVSATANGVYLPKIGIFGDGNSKTINSYELLKGIHTISVSIAADRLNPISGLEYELSSNTINGINFCGTGTFKDADIYDQDANYLYYKVVIQGNGIPELPGRYRYTISSSSMNNSTGEVEVMVGYRKKEIVFYSTALMSAGYSTESGGSKMFLESSVNFGLLPQSITPIDGMERRYLIPANMDITSNSTLINILRSDSPPDIIFLGYASRSGLVSSIIKSYVDNGGVVLFFDETNYGASYSASNIHTYRTLFETPSLQPVSSGDGGAVYPLLNVGNNDPIIAGPFAYLQGKYLGQDITLNQALEGFTTDSPVIVYTNGYSGIDAIAANRVTMCRHSSKGIFYSGDGGFLGNASVIPHSASVFGHPFAISSLYKAAPRDGFGETPYSPFPKGGATVYNSYLFGNLLFWAIDYAEFKGINRLPGSYTDWNK